MQYSKITSTCSFSRCTPSQFQDYANESSTNPNVENSLAIFSAPKYKCKKKKTTVNARSEKKDLRQTSLDFSLGEPEVRIDPTGNGWGNEICCWPSTGGLIVAEGVHAVELQYVVVDRIHVIERSWNATEGDEFCMKLRRIGGKWWDNYINYIQATAYKLKPMYQDERGVIYLGWP